MNTATLRITASVVVVIVLASAFWLLAIAPKKDKAKTLGARVEKLQASVAEQEQVADEAASARKGFAGDYRQFVLLGKAVPADDETASLLVELNRIARQTGVEFRDFELDATAGAAAAPSPTTAPAQPSVTEPPSDDGSSESTGSAPASSTVPATEAAASVLPLGATVGSAGLGVMPYKLTFRGSFFKVAEFIAGIDSLVSAGKGLVSVDGRLMTIDGFALKADERDGFPYLTASFAVTTYLTPSSGPPASGTAPTTPAAPSGTTPVSNTPTTP